jgi:RNA polymerase sigma-70 factor (ECF subfamily)
MPEPPGESDETLAERVRQGEATAFDTLVERHMRRAFAVAYRILRHREDAEDLVQEAFLIALERIDSFERGRSFAPWFFRIVVNRGLNARRSRVLRTTEEIPAGAAARGAGPDVEAERSEAREHISAAAARLPERERGVLRLFELEGFSGAEIAQILEIPDGTVRWHLHRARRAMREMLAPLT